MGTVGNQNPWPPYDNYKDCSLGICTFYCPQFCYLNFPPPPQNDDSTPFSPLIIAIIGMLATAFLLVSYYTIVTRYCKRRNVQTDENEENPDLVSQLPYHAAAAGMDEASIKNITVFRYKKDEGLVDGSECSICLSEFQENESLRLLPKCDHAFHLPCIDTWLKSHTNCPMCRASVISLPYPSVSVNAYEIQRPNDLILVVDEERSISDTFNDHERNFDNGEDLDSEMRNVNILSGDHRSEFNSFERSISLGTFSSQGRLLKIDEDLQVGSDESWKEIGSSKELIGIKRSVSTGGLVVTE